jgi:alpha-glucoside transport system substrate-binding protein
MTRPVRIVAAILAVVVVSGCAGAGAPHTQARSVEVFGPYRGVEADRFIDAMHDFERSTGIHVNYVGSSNFASDLSQRAGLDGDPPDVAVVPQPGLIDQLARDHRIQPLDATVTGELHDNYPASTAVLGHVGAVQYAVPWRLTVKSLVWYRPAVFAAHGWSVPTTLAQLEDLTQTIVNSGSIAPWCFTMGADASTGWTATDWTEDLVLRDLGPTDYTSWADGQLPFADPRIEAAFTQFHDLVLSPGHNAEGLRGAVGIPVEDGSTPLFSDPAGCAMYKQADFADSSFPSNTSVGPNDTVNWFALPDRDGTDDPPLVVGGDQAVQFRHAPEVDALMSYLANADSGISWVRDGGFLSPKSSITAASYPQQFARRLIQLVQTSPTLEFDASDEMPPAVGSGTLWSAITDWVAGVDDYSTFAARVDTALTQANRSGN